MHLGLYSSSQNVWAREEKKTIHSNFNVKPNYYFIIKFML
jgi:hypothetical protein